MTDYRNSSDLYSYLINDITGKGVTTCHQLRQYMKDNGNKITADFFRSTASQFLNMTTPGAPNTSNIVSLTTGENVQSIFNEEFKDYDDSFGVFMKNSVNTFQPVQTEQPVIYMENNNLVIK